MRGSRGLVIRCSHPHIEPHNYLWRREYWRQDEKKNEKEESITSVTKRNSPQRILHHSAVCAAADTPSNVQCAPLNKSTARNYNNNEPKRIVFGSCSSQMLDLSYWERILAISPDLVILMGDNVYGKDGGVEQAYEQWKRHPSFLRMTSSATPIIATLDDNDYYHLEGNMDAAKGAFLHFFQIPKSDERWRPNRGVYTSYVWTDRLQVILLDVRYSKSPFLQTTTTGSGERGGSPRYIPDRDTSKTMLGAEQWQWLERQLKVPVKIRLIVSPIQVLAEGHCWDCWNLFPRERERLLALLSAADGTKTILLSGDRHVAGFYQKDGLYEVTSSSLTHSVPFGLLDQEVDPTRIGGLVHVNNFGLAEVDWDNKNVVVQVSIQRADTGDIIGKEWMRKI